MRTLYLVTGNQGSGKSHFIRYKLDALECETVSGALYRLRHSEADVALSFQDTKAAACFNHHAFEGFKIIDIHIN